MENRKIGNSQAIAFIAIITINHFLLNISYSIIGETKSAAILNTIYIGIIAIILAYIISKLLSKFPTYDILDISNYLMGKAFKTIIGVLFLAYFIFFSGILLYNFSSALKFIYFPNTDVVYIIIFFLLAATFVAMLKNNAVYKNSVIILPIMIISIVALFIFSITNVKMTNMYPILGEGIYNTFFLGISNLFAFQGLAYLYFLPSQLNSPKELTKISITALVVSAIFALITITILLLSDRTLIDTHKLLPLYSSVRKIEFGPFFQRLDSTFLIGWIISFCAYITLTIRTCFNICQKIIDVKKSSIIIPIISIAMFAITFIPKNYSLSTFLTTTVYRYAFFILVLAMSMLILIFGINKKKTEK